MDLDNNVFWFFVLVVGVTRYISLGSIVASASFPLAVWLMSHPPAPVVWAAGVAGLFVVARHHQNIARLAKGAEHKFSMGGEQS